MNQKDKFLYILCCMWGGVPVQGEPLPTFEQNAVGYGTIAGIHAGGAWTGTFTATPTRAEHAGYLAATQTPDGVIHLVGSRLYYQFNLKWIQIPR